MQDGPSSFWMASTPATGYPEIKEDLEVDVAIVGGGIVGITTAYLLKKQGMKVAVIEADRILQGTTGHTTAKITSQHALIYARLKQQVGQELAQQYADANESAIHLIASTAAENNIDCDFSWRPAYVFAQSDKYMKDLEDEAQAACSLGIKASCMDHSPLPFSVRAALRFDDQAQFHPLKYLKSLARQIPGQDSHILERTTAVGIDEDSLAVITRQGQKVTAAKIIIASHFPFFDGGGLYFTKLNPLRAYIIAIRAQETLPEGMFINAESPSRSLRSQSYEDGELILVAGESHQAGSGRNMNAHYQNLLDFAHGNFDVKEVLYRWSTQDYRTLDGIPYVGHLTSKSPHIYVATGFGKWGISNGTASAMVLRDLITKGDSPWAQVYNPSRFNLTAAKTFVGLNLNVGKNLAAGKISRLPEGVELSNGEGRAIQIDGEKYGAFRDDNGELHIVDITCTHLGCELNWNDAEQTWDCPCHGSRFNYTGEVVEGPAFNILHPAGQCPNAVEARIFE
jgi:glycine/D-amino acid oxidase-like deaminating enzyme/nitrite reductase/ring-hydroxylating ferredoxin subunit